MIIIDLIVMVFRFFFFVSFFFRIIKVVVDIIVCFINIDGVVFYFILNVLLYIFMYELYMFVISICYIVLCMNIIIVL